MIAMMIVVIEVFIMMMMIVGDQGFYSDDNEYLIILNFRDTKISQFLDGDISRHFIFAILLFW